MLPISRGRLLLMERFLGRSDFFPATPEFFQPAVQRVLLFLDLFGQGGLLLECTLVSGFPVGLLLVQFFPEPGKDLRLPVDLPGLFLNFLVPMSGLGFLQRDPVGKLLELGFQIGPGGG